MKPELEELKLELEHFEEKTLRIKEYVKNLLYLWEEGRLQMDGENIISEILGIMEDLEI